MNKRTVRAYCQDSIAFWRPSRDELLTPTRPAKLLVNGWIWTGTLKPLLDARLDVLEPLVNGLTPGRVLHAEQVPATLDLGRTWVGEFQTRLSASTDEVGGGIDVSEVMQELDALYQAMGTSANQGAISDSIKRVRRVSDGLTKSSRTADAAPYGGLTRTRELSRLTVQKMHMQQAIATATKDNEFEVREAVHAASHATNARDRLAAMNRAGAAFWDRPSLVR